jgi:hypothetical protein
MGSAAREASAAAATAAAATRAAAAARVPAKPRQLKLLRRERDPLGREGARRLGGAGLPRGDHGGACGLRLRQRRGEPSALDLGILQQGWGWGLGLGLGLRLGLGG